VVQEAVLGARRRVWIATANLKDMQLALANRRYQPILQTFDRLAADGVAFRVVHADLPSRPFRRTLERFPRLTGGGLELQVCPRSHWKLVLVDGKAAYFGSANLTGAGLGVKKENRRNFELGAFTRNPAWVSKLTALFDAFWMGAHCPACAFRKRCPDPIESP
jgi:phosphatidylserine/phosphatidylglycerophosphate/cardiolipin synthase-like enzyme